MLLTFSKPEFVQLIKSGVKKHTIRNDHKNRWKKDMKIHFWKGNPRNNRLNPYQFAEGIVADAMPITINLHAAIPRITINGSIYADSVSLHDIAKNDGFKNINQMAQFFPEYFEGKLIIWNQKLLKITK